MGKLAGNRILTEQKDSVWLSLYAHSGFIYESVKREFQLRYRNSLLGASWVILNPLAMIFVYTIIFSKVMQARLPDTQGSFAYSVFLMSGVLPWGLLIDMLSRGPSLFLDQASLLKKIQFPKMSLVIIATLNSLLNFAIIYALFIGFLILCGQFPGWSIFAVIPLLILQVWMCAALLLILAILNVFFRDVAPLTGIALQFGFWLTPIVYAPQMIPEAYRSYLFLNPLSAIFDSYHRIFVYQQYPDWSSLYPALLLAVILTFIGWRLFIKRSAEMVDEL